MDGNEAVAGQLTESPAPHRSGRSRQLHIPNKWERNGTKEVAVGKLPTYKI